jgi:hypothetical protein
MCVRFGTASLAMPIVPALTVLNQACFIFHVFKTGRPYWWAFVILAFPVLGCVVYYLVEVFPNSQAHRAVRKTVRRVAQVMAPDAEFLRRVERFRIRHEEEQEWVAAARRGIETG